MNNASLALLINQELGLSLSNASTDEALREHVQAFVSSLINNQFEQLVNILYRVDVNENRLKFLLEQKVGEDASVIIADLIIDRQREKIRLRAQFTRPADDDNNNDAEERW